MDAQLPEHWLRKGEDLIKSGDFAVHIAAKPVHMQQFISGKVEAAVIHHGAILGNDPPVERIQKTGFESCTQKIREVAHAFGELVGDFYINDTTVHAPPVVHGLLRVLSLLPGAVENGTDNPLIEGTPEPAGGSQRGQCFVLFHQIGAILTEGKIVPERCRNIPVGDYLVPQVNEFSDRVARLAGPAQIDTRPGVGHLGAQSEGIDGGRNAVDGG